MSAFSRYYELNGEDDSVSLDDIYEFVEQNINADEIYTSLLIKNYEGKNIEVKITDIAKDKWYNKKLAEAIEY
jgi:ribosomal protein L12E/L44/L45/RPP1/RPP2